MLLSRCALTVFAITPIVIIIIIIIIIVIIIKLIKRPLQSRLSGSIQNNVIVK